jgi:hypothetical protein
MPKSNTAVVTIGIERWATFYDFLRSRSPDVGEGVLAKCKLLESRQQHCSNLFPVSDHLVQSLIGTLPPRPQSMKPWYDSENNPS